MGINVKQNTIIGINLSIESDIEPILQVMLPDGSNDPLIDQIPFHEVSDNRYFGFHTFDNIGVHHLVHTEFGIDQQIDVSENCGVAEFELCFLND